MKQRLRHFTLVELLTATAILLIIMTILVQMLSTLMKGWRLSESNARLYANAKEVLNILQDDLNSVDCYRRPWFGPVTLGNGNSAMVRIDGSLPYQATGNIRIAIPTRNAAGDTVEAHYYYKPPQWNAAGVLQSGTATLYRRETPKELCDYTVQGMESSWWKTVTESCSGTTLPPPGRPPLKIIPWDLGGETAWQNQCRQTWAGYETKNETEDLNGNNLLDAGEDLNNNGRIDTADLNGNGVIDVPTNFCAPDMYAWMNWRNTLKVSAAPSLPSYPLVGNFFADPATTFTAWSDFKTNWNSYWRNWAADATEDANGNGMLDAGEDLNGNGVLDRPNWNYWNTLHWKGIDGSVAWGPSAVEPTPGDDILIAEGVVEFSLKASTRSPSSSLYMLLVSITVVDPDEIPKDRNKDGSINALDYTSRHTFTRLLVVP